MIRSYRGKSPKIHPTAFVSEAAYIVGDVEIGEYSSVWPGTVIRADVGKIVIGKHTNIQDNCVVHADHDARMGDNCTLGHSVTWHGRILGDNSLVGNGAVANDGVETGPFCIISAGSVVLEETKIPERSIVRGIPGKVAGPTEERHIQLIQGTARSYSNKAQLFKAEGLGDPSLPK